MTPKKHASSQSNKKMTPKKPSTSGKRSAKRKKLTPFQELLAFVESNRFFVIVCLSLICLIIILVGIVIHNTIEKKKIASIDEYIDAACAEFDVPKKVVMAVIKTESDFDPYAESSKEARGLMQITKITLEEINNRLGTNYTFGQMFDPEINIRCGVFYLSYLIEEFDGYYDTAFAAYNAGPTRVRKEWLSNPDYSRDQKQLYSFPEGYKETEDYVEKVNRYMKDYS